jgi:hypothetical protein
MAETQNQRLAAAILQTVATWTTNGGNLPAMIGQVLAANAGDILPGDGLAHLLPAQRADGVERRGVAVDLIRRHGRVTSGQLAKHSYCSDESARLCLAAMVRGRVLRRVGQFKGTAYIPGVNFPTEGA